MNNNIKIFNYNNKNKIVISPISYIGNNHPYKMYTIINLCISSSLLITNYTIAKTSIFLYFIYIFNNNIFLIIIMLFFVLYPIIFIGRLFESNILISILILLYIILSINMYNYNSIQLYNILISLMIITIDILINIYILKYLYKDKNVIRFVCIIMLFTYNMILLILI
jgi:NADH:ubiquinone oxidoreductase subunit 5 (subunit L)/multisubunit Na+/H+ antiporter MnhA subunit